jgi:hypothetical protein
MVDEGEVEVEVDVEEEENEEEENEEEDLNLTDNNLKLVNINELLLIPKNPCKCLNKEKCIFKNLLVQTKLDLDKENDLQKATALLLFKCVNDDCQSLMYEFCLPVISKQKLRTRTKCLICYDNDSLLSSRNSTTDPLFKILSLKQE